MSQLVWLITNCSSEFGEDVVLRAAARGDRVIATDPDPATIEHLKGDNIYTLGLDISESQADIDQAVAKAFHVFGRIDTLVNNAGDIHGGLMEHVSEGEWIRVYLTNMVRTVSLTRAILPYFRYKQSGTVVFMGSRSSWVGDFGATPSWATEFATEGVLEDFQKGTEAFHNDTYTDGIRSIIVEPDYFRTNFMHPSKLMEMQPIEAYDTIIEGMYRFFLPWISRKSARGSDEGFEADDSVTVVRSEGMAAGKDLPTPLPLGFDPLAVTSGHFQTLKLCDK